MTKGSITRLVTSYGTKWGRIRPDTEMREIFFDPRALDHPSVYEVLFLGQTVDFDEEPERVNGSHAIHVRTRLDPAGEGVTGPRTSEPGKIAAGTGETGSPTSGSVAQTGQPAEEGSH